MFEAMRFVVGSPNRPPKPPPLPRTTALFILLNPLREMYITLLIAYKHS